MKMKKKNWDACGMSGPDGGPEATIGFFKKTEGFTFTKDQWDYFKETMDWIFETLEEGE